MTQETLLENLGPSLKQCSICHQWFEKRTFSPKSARCKECDLARRRERSRAPEQVQRRKDRRANPTPEQREAERERGRLKFVNRTPEQVQRDYEYRLSRKETDNARARELRAQSPERRAKDRASVRNSTLKQKYGVTPEMYRLMYDDQGGKCYFCEYTPESGKKRLAVDHVRDTPYVRGLLCGPCNANWVDEYLRLPEEYRDSKRTNDYLLRGKSGDYIEGIRQRVEASRHSE